MCGQGIVASQRISAVRVGSIKAEHGDERLVDGPHLVGCQSPHTTPEPLAIDGTELFDEHASGSSSDRHLRTKRSRTSTC